MSVQAPEQLLTAAEVGEWLGFSPATIVDWYERGDLPGYKLGGKLRFDRWKVEKWLESREKGREEELAPASTTRARSVTYLVPASTTEEV